MEKLVVILLCLPVFGHGQALDQTLQPSAHGEDVVDAVIDKIRSECILIDDKYIMRRIAAVETDFGRSSNSLAGGIWKINSTDLNDVQLQCQNSLRTMCDAILQSFSFDVSQATIIEMDIPLYSALIMYLRFANLENSGTTIPASASDQAQFWVDYINPSGDKNVFIEKSSIKISCSAVKMELIFTIDASGSVGAIDFQKTLSFLQNVVQNLQIGSDMTRVAVIRYSNSPYLSFDLDTYNNKQNILDNISKIIYTGGGTDTAKAIDLARTTFFSHARKNVPRVLVLITDGRSDSQTATVSAADVLKKDGTTIFTIGIGSVNYQEMLAVASSPNCAHFFSLSSYSEIDAIISEIQRESCTAPLTVEPRPRTMNETSMNETSIDEISIDDNPIPSNNETKTQNVVLKPVTPELNATTDRSRNTTTVKVVVDCGTVNIYGANNFNPSAARNTYKTVATDGINGRIESPAKDPLYLSLVSQKRLDLDPSECTNPHYNISINPPNEQNCSTPDRYCFNCGDVNRADWQAEKAKKTTPFSRKQLKYVVVHHSATPECSDKSSCIRRIQSIQDHHMIANDWDDIGYNFLIGGDGNIYEGRGMNNQGAHTPRYNNVAMGICMIGNFEKKSPTYAALHALESLLTCFGKEFPGDFQLKGHRDFKFTKCPGQALYDILMNCPHYHDTSEKSDPPPCNPQTTTPTPTTPTPTTPTTNTATRFSISGLTNILLIMVLLTM